MKVSYAQVLVIVFILVVFWVFFSKNMPPAPQHTLQNSEKSPKFFWSGFDGDTVYLEDLHGKVVLLNYWATWCVFCTREMPALDKLQNKYKNDLMVIGVHRSDTEPLRKGKEFAENIGVTYKLVEDGKTANSYRYFARGSQWMPTSVIIGRDGFVQEIIFGDRNEEQWENLIKPVLENMYE